MYIVHLGFYDVYVYELVQVHAFVHAHLRFCTCAFAFFIFVSLYSLHLIFVSLIFASCHIRFACKFCLFASMRIKQIIYSLLDLLYSLRSEYEGDTLLARAVRCHAVSRTHSRFI